MRVVGCMQELAAQVEALHVALDDSVRAWCRSYEGKGGRIYCRKGCGNCCRLAVHATFPEALRIAEALTPPQSEALRLHVEGLLPALLPLSDLKSYLRAHRAQGRFCPFLGEGAECGVYALRPFACRALVSTRNADYCGIDLSTLHPLEKEAFLSSLDPRVVAFPTHYGAAPQEDGMGREMDALQRMSEIFGFRLSGNLALLVWLVRERALYDAVSRGGGAVADLLRRERIPPFVVELAR